MNATTIRTTSHNTTRWHALAALALALLAALITAQAVDAVGASMGTISKRLGALKQDCDQFGGTFEATYNYDKNGNLVTVVATCSDAHGDIWSCDVSTRSKACVPALIATSTSPFDRAIVAGAGVATDGGAAGSGDTGPHAGTRAQLSGDLVLLAADEDDDRR